MEALLLLIIAQNAWLGFGRHMLLGELFLSFLPVLTVLTIVTIDRGNIIEKQRLSINRHAATAAAAAAAAAAAIRVDPLCQAYKLRALRSAAQAARRRS